MRLDQQLTLFQLKQEVNERSGSVRRTYVCSEHEPVLKFVQKFNRVFFVTFEGIATAAGGKVAIKIRIFPHEFRDDTLLFYGRKWISIALYNIAFPCESQSRANQ